MKRSRSPFVVACIASALLAACTVQDTNSGVVPAPAGDGGIDGAADGGATAGGNASDLTCTEILDCATKCPDEDVDACANACVERGTPQGQSAVSALVSCYEANACTDAACLQTSCSAELNTCVTEERPGGKPIDGTVPAGSVPPALVGEWSYFYSPTAHRHDFTFNADGTAAEYLTTTTSSLGGCMTTGISDTTGSVVFTDTTFTYYRTAGTSTWIVCQNKTTEPAKPTSREYAWSIDASGNLVIADRGIQACIDDPGRCTHTYTKK